MDTEMVILELMTARSEDPRRTEDAHPRREHGWTPLHAAVAFGDLDRVQALLGHDRGRGLLRASSNDGWTPLHVAAALNGNPIAAGLSPDDKKDSGLDVLGHLLEKNGDRNARNKDGWTPLHVAAALNHNAEVVERLLNSSGCPPPGVKDRKGRTPLHMAAAMNSSPRVMKLLLKCCETDPNARTENCSTPLHEAAAKAKNPEIVRLLVKCYGADPNARNKAGWTPLHRAAKKTRNREIVRLLLESGADPRLKNEKGELAVDLAEKNKRLRGTEVYWQLHDAKYLPHQIWNGTVRQEVRNRTTGARR